MKAHLVGSGIASLAAASYLIRDAKVPAGNITVYEGEAAGGAMASYGGSGTYYGGYVLPAARILEREYRCTLELFSHFASVSNPLQTLEEDVREFNRVYPYEDATRLLNKAGEVMKSRHFGVSLADRFHLLKLLLTPERKLEDRTISEFFTKDFYRSEFWLAWSTMMGPMPEHSAIEMRRYLIRFLHIVPDILDMTTIWRMRMNQNDSVARPIRDWLKGVGVDFPPHSYVDDVTFDRERTAAISMSVTTGGVPVPVAIDPGEDKILMTLGTTALTVRLDPEDMRGVIAAYNRSCAEAIERHGGFVAKYLGDGVLAYFGYPEAHESDPELAVEAGLAIVQNVPKLETPAGSPLHVRVGIATGIVVVGDLVGSGASEERGVVGATPNLAARLQGIAEPDRVVIGDGTRRLLGSLYDLTDLGAVKLKGISGPTRAWAVLGPSSVESHFEALRGAKLTAFVGREDESELLLSHWMRAKAGEGQVVLLLGEPGVGKSRLAAEFLKRIADEPQVRFRYYCSPQHRDSALYPVIGQMERLAEFTRDDTPRARLDKLDALLAQTATSPQDAALLADMLSLRNDGRYPPLDLPPPQRRQRIMRALGRQIETLAREQPLLMVLEDAHWADPTTMEVFGRLVDRIETLRALLLVIYRPDIEPPWLGRAHVTALVLTRLTSREIGAMIDDVAGEERLPAPARQEIARRADGVPLFAEEMTKAVLEAQGDGDSGKTAAAVPSPALAVPASLHDSLMARLDRLGPAKEVAQVAAAIGRESPHALLALVAEQTESELEAALERLVRAGLLFRQGRPPEATYLFKHTLLQELAYGALLRERKRALHARIAEALEAHFHEVGENQPELLARHCAEAGLPEKAAALWGKAGRHSLKRSALLEAESHFSRALARIAAQSSTPGLRREEIACQIGLASTLLLRRGYTSTEAKASLSRTLALIERADSLGEPVDDPLALFTTLHGFWVASIVASSGDETRELAARCLALAEKAGAKGELIAGHRAVGQTLLFSGDFTASRAHFDKAIALFNPTEDQQATRYGGDHWSTALSARAAALWVLGYPDAAQADAAEALRSARDFGHALTQGNNLIFVAWTHFCCGRYAIAKA